MILFYIDYSIQNMKVSTSIQVVCALIFRSDQKLLIVQRNNEQSNGYLWEFPGGKIEAGESESECLHRELKEELNLSVSIHHKFCTVFKKSEGLDLELMAYICKPLHTDFELLEHLDHHWLDIHSMMTRVLCPADYQILTKLRIRSTKSV